MSTPIRLEPEVINTNITSDQIRDYLAANPGMSDRDIAQAMQQHGVSHAMMADATGVDRGEVGRRYTAAMKEMYPKTPTPPERDYPDYPKGEPGFPREVGPTHPPYERPPGFSSVNEIIGSKYPADMLEEVRAKTEADRKKMATEYGLPETKKFMLERRAPQPADGLDFATMSAAGPMTTLSARGGTRLMKKGGSVKKMTKGKW